MQKKGPVKGIVELNDEILESVTGGVDAHQQDAHQQDVHQYDLNKIDQQQDAGLLKKKP